MKKLVVSVFVASLLLGAVPALASDNAYNSNLMVSAVCPSGSIWNVTNVTSNQTPFKWEIKSFGVVLDSGQGIVSDQPVTVTTRKIGANEEMFFSWPSDVRYVDGNQNSANLGVGCFDTSVVSEPTVAPIPTSVVVPSLPRVEIAGRTYEVSANPITLRDLRIKLIYLLEQLFDQTR